MIHTMNTPGKAKRVVIVAPVGLCAAGQSYARAFSSFGYRVMLFNRRAYFPFSFSLSSKIINRLTRKSKLIRYNRELIKNVVQFKPTSLVIAKGVEIFPETLREISEQPRAPTIININHDDYFSRAAGNRFFDLEAAIPYYHYFFPTKKINVPELRARGAREVHYLPFGYDSSLYIPIQPTRDEYDRYFSDVVFIGNYETGRAREMEMIADLSLSIWGRGWNKWKVSAALRKCYRKPYCLSNQEMDFSKAANSSRIALNFLRKENRDTLNPRAFELPACGVFVLSQRSEELMEHFDEGREIVTFTSGEELRDKVRYYLHHDREREKIAIAGLKKVRAGRHTIRDRVNTLLKICAGQSGFIK